MDGRSAVKGTFSWQVILGACLLASLFAPTWAQKTSAGSGPNAESSKTSAPAGTTPVSLIVSVEAKNGKEVPAVSREDVVVFHLKDRLKVTDWVPVESEQASLQLFLLIDEGVTMDIGMQFDDLRHFINEQPPTTVIALGYLRYGTVQVAQNFTADHAKVAKALRLPMGFVAADASPYLAVTDVMKRWPTSASPREILLVSDGIDPLQPGIVDSYLDQSIVVAQREGIQIYSIYASSAGHFGHTLWRESGPPTRRQDGQKTPRGSESRREVADRAGWAEERQRFRDVPAGATASLRRSTTAGRMRPSREPRPRLGGRARPQPKPTKTGASGNWSGRWDGSRWRSKS